jgi:hypothetical protein
MSTTPRQALLLELDPGSDPISGRLGDSADSVEFSGWLGLASAIQRLLDHPHTEEESTCPACGREFSRA